MKKITTLLTAVLFPLFCMSEQFINHKGQDVFVSGINLAWINFNNDLNQFSEYQFGKIMEDIASAGGNSARWWLHVNGKGTPSFTNDTVSGIEEAHIANLVTALDIAAEQGIVLSLCLWSFDMMHGQLADTYKNRNRRLLEDSASTMAYVRNALIPMVEATKGHPAILCWEIFNEPEGMTDVARWSHVDDVPIESVQQFVNLCAGAIKRTDPEAKVSNGSWNVVASTNVEQINAYNYYSDSALIDAGGDPDGTLDFYQIHYYPEWEGEDKSPFHNSVDHWELDKPYVIGEFPALGIVPYAERFKPRTELTPEECYNWAFDNGYAGALSWTYTNHDGFGGLDDIRSALADLKEKHPENIIIKRDPNYNYLPKQVADIATVILLKEQMDEFIVADLDTVFSDEGDLSYTIEAEGDVSAELKDNTLLVISANNDAGIGTVTITATEESGRYISTSFKTIAQDTASVDKLEFRQGFAQSKKEGSIMNLTDHNKKTRWESTADNNQTIEFDLLKSYPLSRLVIDWGYSYALSYEISISADNSSWTNVFSVNNGDGKRDNIIFESTEARYLKLELLDKEAVRDGYIINDIYAYSTDSAVNNQAPIADPKDFDIAIPAGTIDTIIDPFTSISDPDGDILSFSVTYNGNTTLPDWLTVSESPAMIITNPTSSDAGQYELSIAGTDWFGQSVTVPLDLRVTVVTNVQHVNETSTSIWYGSDCGSVFIANSNKGTVSVYNAGLREVMSVDVQQINGIVSIDATSLLAGYYILIYVTANETVQQSFIVDRK